MSYHFWPRRASNRVSPLTTTYANVQALAATMSSTMTKGTTAAGGDSKTLLASQPVPVIDSPLSKGAALARPALLLSLLALRFDALVADPVATLQSSLPAVALVQAAYAVLCLPVAGSQVAKTPKKPRPGEKKKDASGPNKISVRHVRNGKLCHTHVR